MSLTIDPNFIDFAEQSPAPNTPSAGDVRVYAKTDSKIYIKNDAGIETELGGGGFSDFNVAADSGTPATIDDGETLTISGGTGLTSSVSSNTVTIDFNGLSLTTETAEIWKELADTTLGSNGSFDIDLSTGEALNCTHLKIVCLLRGAVSALTEVVRLFYNNDTTATNYYRQRISAATSTSTNDFGNDPLIGIVNGNTAEANNFSMINVFVPDFRNTSNEKITESIFGQYESTVNGRAGIVSHQWQNTAAITRVQIRTDNHPTDLFLTGSRVWVYGLKSISFVTNVTVS